MSRTANVATALWIGVFLVLQALPVFGDSSATIVSRSPGPVHASHGMVAAEHELAARAGAEILAAGGNAVDAAVAAAFATGVVNPSSCGVGGGGFLLAYDAESGTVHALDFREEAPGEATRDMYLRGGEVVPNLSVHGGLAVGVPGEVLGLATALDRLGTLPLARVLEPSIRYALSGFPVGSHLASVLERYHPRIRKHPVLAATFLKDEGRPYKQGETLVRPGLAATLNAIARVGPSAFYEGAIAERIVQTVQRHGGILRREDLEAYQVRWREPVRGTYRGLSVYGFPPPSSGGGALVEALNVLGGFDLASRGPNDLLTRHRIAETMKLVFADRAQHYGDPDFVEVPLERLLSSDHAAKLRERIRTDSVIQVIPNQVFGDEGGTAHLSVMDRHGNAVALTHTINTAFGSLVAVPGTGIILNNEMDDFSAAPGEPNVYGLVGTEANSIRPGKRPLSSMSPTLVLRGKRPLLSVGGSGGPRIITATLQTILNVVDFDQDLPEALRKPRIHHQWLPNLLFVEPGLPSALTGRLRKLGHELREVESLAAVQATHRTDEGFVGMADPRKHGGTAGW